MGSTCERLFFLKHDGCVVATRIKELRMDGCGELYYFSREKCSVLRIKTHLTTGDLIFGLILRDNWPADRVMAFNMVGSS